MTPDPGWSYNPGVRDFNPPDPTGPVLQGPRAGVPTWRDVGAPATLPPRPAPPKLDGDFLAQIKAAGGRSVVRSDGRPDRLAFELRTPIGPVWMTREYVEHTRRGRDDRRALQHYVSRTLADPDEIWYLTEHKGGRWVSRVCYLASFEGVDSPFIFVAQDEQFGRLSWTAYEKENFDKARWGHLLYARWRRR